MQSDSSIMDTIVNALLSPFGVSICLVIYGVYRSFNQRGGGAIFVTFGLVSIFAFPMLYDAVLIVLASK